MNSWGRGRSNAEKVHLKGSSKHQALCGAQSMNQVGTEAAVAVTCKNCQKKLAKQSEE